MPTTRPPIYPQPPISRHSKQTILKRSRYASQATHPIGRTVAGLCVPIKRIRQKLFLLAVLLVRGPIRRRPIAPPIHATRCCHESSPRYSALSKIRSTLTSNLRRWLLPTFPGRQRDYLYICVCVCVCVCVCAVKLLSGITHVTWGFLDGLGASTPYQRWSRLVICLSPDIISDSFLLVQLYMHFSLRFGNTDTAPCMCACSTIH